MVLIYLNPCLVRIVKYTKKIDDGGFNFSLKLDKKEWLLLNDKNKQKIEDF